MSERQATQPLEHTPANEVSRPWNLRGATARSARGGDAVLLVELLQGDGQSQREPRWLSTVVKARG
ncbi:hypothetical protein [Haladaptatus pallidirubidus]|uniref:hypothetical protein n=1 Tax=Haladaptatus pallidirubidus TaxID=1008152 RepID=UPI001D11BA8B|nr:hypothetical protein [Haladaptatus pallidirubidus]